eukprot:Skav213448  [mRNA]  locus=scaffold837:354344:359291:- [translate_table: standard]
MNDLVAPAHPFVVQIVENLSLEMGLLRRSAVRFKHIYAAGDKQYVGCWEMIPPTMGKALGPVSYAARTPVPKDGAAGRDWILRGSGIHGPENGEVMKLALWNRLKQRRPQRQVTTAELQEYFRMEIATVWWMFGCVFFVAPLNWWGKKYRGLAIGPGGRRLFGSFLYRGFLK